MPATRLERYAYFWNIRGSQWLKPWTRIREGFGQTFDEETDRQLLTLNVWREGAMEPLQTLHEVWLSGRTVSERLHALRAFLEQTHFPEIACEQTNELYRQGKHQAAQEQEQLYEILMTAMEQAELVLGAQEMELDRFLQMFRMLLGCYQGRLDSGKSRRGAGIRLGRHARAAGWLSNCPRCRRGRASCVFPVGGAAV